MHRFGLRHAIRRYHSNVPIWKHINYEMFSFIRVESRGRGEKNKELKLIRGALLKLKTIRLQICPHLHSAFLFERCITRRNHKEVWNYIKVAGGGEAACAITNSLSKSCWNPFMGGGQHSDHVFIINHASICIMS